MAAEGFVVPSGEGKVFNMGSPGRSAALKVLNGQSGQSVMMFEEVAPANTATDLHLHRDSDEIAYVLSGQVTFKIGDEITVGGPGACAFMPRGVAHAWKTTGDEPGRVLFLYAPGSAGMLFEEASEVDPASPPSDPAAFFSALVQRHGWEIVGPPPF
jgi:quercetin dioxygenase-like cupin family protein